MPSALTCSVVIATLDRWASLGVVLRCLAAQSRPPAEIVIVVAGEPPPPEVVGGAGTVPVRLVSGAEKSAARQRNLGATLATGQVLAFLDDDIEFGPELFAAALARFDEPPAGGIAALSPRIANTGRLAPGRLTRWYYALQAGYLDRDYGGRLFGPGINCFPVYRETGPDLIPVEWLPATCLFVAAPLFQRHRFPLFTGYSFAEDVHLTARLAREAPLYFLRTPAILHHSLPSEFKKNHAALVAGKLHNMAVVARETMGLGGWALWWRWQLHRLFLTGILCLRRPAGAGAELRGIWGARL